MLSKEDNELLSRIGPGTAMGNLMREYWIPAVKSDELPAPDCPPLRLKLLGEELIAFRMTSGKVGAIQNSCPHRGASLFFGRNEEEGLRCVYHGWKFNETGSCVDMPSEPAESNFKSKVHATAYPTYEHGGVIWAYMGPRSSGEEPPLPQIEAFMLSSGPSQVSAIHRPCNWMQGWEGEMDTVHAAFLHFGASKPEDQKPGSFNFYQANQRHAKFSVVETDFGTSYGAYRPAEADTYYWRMAHMLFPFYAMIPQGEIGKDAKIGAYVPMDDEHTMHWEIFLRPEILGGPGVDRSADPRPLNQGRAKDEIQEFIDQRQQTVRTGGSGANGGPTSTGNLNLGLLPNTTGWFGRFNLPQALENDYMIDREAQRTWKSFTGIPGVRQQDMAVTETMGPIYKRYNEHLGTTDAMIIRTRRKLLAAAKALRDEGVLPPGVDNPEVYRQRSGECILPRDVFWWDATKPMREVFEVAEIPPAFVKAGA